MDEEQLLDLLFGSGSTPIRRSIRLRVTFDENGVQRTEAVDGEAFTLSEQGSVDRVEATQDRFLNCGCLRTDENVAGQCATRGCGRTSCAKCFTRCLRCRRPLCLEHARYLEIREEVISLCVVCEDIVSRQFFWNRVTRGLLPSPGL